MKRLLAIFTLLSLISYAAKAQDEVSVDYAVQGGHGKIMASYTNVNGEKLTNEEGPSVEENESGKVISTKSDNVIIFTAVPDEGYHVDSWLLDGDAVYQDDETKLTSNSYSLTMDDDYNVRVIFAKDEKAKTKYVVEAFSSNEDFGNVSIADAEGNVIASGSQVDDGTILSVTAVLTNVGRFKQWEINGVVSEDKNYTLELTVGANIVVDGKLVIKAVFLNNEEEKPSYPVEAIYNAELGQVRIIDQTTNSPITSGSKIMVGTQLIFKALSKENIKFIEWKVNGVKVNTEAYQELKQLNLTLSDANIKDGKLQVEAVFSSTEAVINPQEVTSFSISEGRITFNSLSKQIITLYDMSGKMILRKNVNIGSYTLPQIKKGAYVLRINGQVEKLIL